MDNEVKKEAEYAAEASEKESYCQYREIPRTQEDLKKLQNRINRIIGQMSGIKTMLDDNRYCGDIMIQIGAVESALRGLGFALLQEHLETCVTQEVCEGNREIMGEVVELVRRM